DVCSSDLVATLRGAIRGARGRDGPIPDSPAVRNRPGSPVRAIVSLPWATAGREPTKIERFRSVPRRLHVRNEGWRGVETPLPRDPVTIGEAHAFIRASWSSGSPRTRKGRECDASRPGPYSDRVMRGDPS